MTQQSTNDPLHAFHIDVARAEIAGKNAAIHAYDSMMWRVRSGYLTLLFAAWGYILGGALGKDANIALIHRVTLSMLVISIGLALAGLLVDLNLKKRKFRVIASLNKLYAALWHGVLDSSVQGELRVAGDSGGESYAQVAGYSSSRNLLFIIYGIPVALVAVGLYLAGLF